MSDSEFMYMGKKIVIQEEYPNATVSVDGRDFKCHYDEAKDGQGLGMWVCDEAYFTSPDLTQLARHFADYGYMFDAPGRVVVDDAGAVVDRPDAHEHGTSTSEQEAQGGQDKTGADNDGV